MQLLISEAQFINTPRMRRPTRALRGSSRPAKVLKGDEVERQTSTGGLIDGWMSCSCITATSSRLEVISHTDFIDHRHYHRENAARFHLYSDNNGTVGCFLSRVVVAQLYRARHWNCADDAPFLCNSQVSFHV